MEYAILPEERAHLRELARKQAEYAALPIMEERRRMWYALNDAQAGARPPVIIETWTFDRDFLPDNLLRCTSRAGRFAERQMLRNIRNHELINDDKVIPDTFDMRWFTHINEFGVEYGRDVVKDAEGVETGYHWHHPIKDLRTDLELLKPAECSVDREGTLAFKAEMEELLGEYLPVRISYGGHAATMLTHRVIELMGMEAFFMAMYDCPDELHQLMAYLRDNALRILRWQEAEGLLTVNNANDDSFGSSYNFTTGLPAPGYEGGPARLVDFWGASNSQETVGVSPRKFHEFCAPYYRDVCEPFGKVYYGCCEPAHPFWGDISQLPHLKKVSISRWCDENFMGDALRGTEIVYSRKPDPNFLSVDQTLDEEAWAAHIRTTLEATGGVFTEFIIRDVYTLHGNIGNASRAIEVARREIDAHHHG